MSEKYFTAEYDNEKETWYVWDNDKDKIVKWFENKNDAYRLANKMNDEGEPRVLPYALDEDTFGHEAKKIYDDLINEFSGVGGIVGYQAPLGSNPAKSKELDVYAGHRTKKDKSRKEDSDEKIRNAGSENGPPYAKIHPLLKTRSKP